AGLGFLPALRIAEKELHHVGAVGLSIGQRIVSVNMRTNKHAASLVSRPDTAGERRLSRQVGRGAGPVVAIHPDRRRVETLSATIVVESPKDAQTAPVSLLGRGSDAAEKQHGRDQD